MTCELDSPLGTLTLECDGSALTSLRLPAEPRPAASVTPAQELPEVLSSAARQLEEYFRGERQTFDLPLAPRGTAFQLKVWSALREIPWGETVSYGELARRIGQPKASRAVGLANGRNPLPIVIPCHRVIGADGSLTGYGGGLEAKRALLELERALPGAPADLPLFAAPSTVSGSC